MVVKMIHVEVEDVVSGMLEDTVFGMDVLLDLAKSGNALDRLPLGSCRGHEIVPDFLRRLADAIENPSAAVSKDMDRNIRERSKTLQRNIS